MVSCLLQMNIMVLKSRHQQNKHFYVPGACRTVGLLHFFQLIASVHLKSLVLDGSHYTIELSKYFPLLGQGKNTFP